jgi:hypothetical protein
MAVRVIKLLGALVVIGGLAAGPAEAQSTTAKNFLPAPDTPSYFVDESAPVGGQDEASSAASQRAAATTAAARPATASPSGKDRHPAGQPPTGVTRAEAPAHSSAERDAAVGRKAEARKAAEANAVRRPAEVPQQAAQLTRPDKEMAVEMQAEREAKAGRKIAASQTIERPAAHRAPAKPIVANQAKRAVPKLPEPVAALPVKADARRVAREKPRRLAGIGNPAPIPHIAAGDGQVRAANMFGATVVALGALGFLWQRRRHPHAASPPGAAILGVGPTRDADLNALLTELAPRIRRKLPRRTPFRLSLLPELWPCHADETAVAAAVIDLTGAAAADLSANGSVVVGTRNFRVDADHAAQSQGAVPGDYVRLTLRENGRGLPETAFEQIFDPVATVRPAIIRAGDVMRRLGGFVRVETAEDVGTAVHLYFRPVVAVASASTGSR